MAGALLAVVSLPKKSGIPADRVQNTFAFITADSPATTTEMNNISTKLQNFYKVAPPGGFTNEIRDYLSAAFDATANCEITFYDITAHLGGSPHGSPLRTDTFSLGAVGATSGANEIAACLTFRADYDTDVEFGVGTRPRARDRGRVYIGPLIQAAIQQRATTLEPYLGNPPADVIAAAAGKLRDDLLATTPWSVWSRADNALKSVVAGWVDDEPDTQRRRGSKPTLRNTF